MSRCSWKMGAYCITGMLGKGEETSEKFARSCFSVSPLVWRVPILLWSASTFVWSITFFWGSAEKFFLYMTHWGLLFIIVESMFGIIVTMRRNEYLDATFGLPWYVKTYWVLYNISIPVAFLITIFYWGILRKFINTLKYAPDPILDIMLHAVNSAVMFIELICSAHPSRLMHIMQPLWFAGVYMLFTVIYFFAGGVDPWGNPFIYPVVDWAKPEQTLVVITLTALFLALMHLITVAIASARDFITRRRLPETTGIFNDGFGA
ncbi:hypothetical protein K1T71_001735 [Dendrolimus kikuchii]|uniref:Uncharacterized protein n=1 Tax=Dendrolimus kikuchii TaxID=765133 RepID=A0ACC1DES7_9NEOP|nr:hypothetical protein K1T71_001735 [Dendrolimus kikuchii]